LWPTTFLWDAKNVLKVKKIAILIEDITGLRPLGGVEDNDEARRNRAKAS
jgi:hypothetical protein